MLMLVKSKADKDTLIKVAEDFDGYVKVVVDLRQEILVAGGRLHADAEQLLLKEAGSKQEDLWGGGLDLETGEVDFDSMINLRPSQGNPSREVLSPDIRKKIEKIIRRLLT